MVLRVRNFHSGDILNFRNLYLNGTTVQYDAATGELSVFRYSHQVATIIMPGLNANTQFLVTSNGGGSNIILLDGSCRNAEARCDFTWRSAVSYSCPTRVGKTNLLRTKLTGTLSKQSLFTKYLQRLIIGFASGAEKLYQRPFVPIERQRHVSSSSTP